MQTNELPVADLPEALAEVDPALLHLVPLDLCQRLRIVPMARKGNALVIGFYENLTSASVYELQLLTGLRVISIRLSKQKATSAGLESMLGTRPTPAFARPGLF